ncbi:hypothetical protein Adt_31721 [Abeliophyllum distichum]|uniref:Uncharacterized protein n=1 Tax=Abeliophyllum distichum TaxID=126358 RepID=A0ABD1RF03_9LAMI
MGSSSAAKIIFSKPKKNPTLASASKTMKITSGEKSLPPSREVVILEPSRTSVMPTQDEILGRAKEKVVGPPPKVKPIPKSIPPPRDAQLGSSSGEKRPSSDNKPGPAKRIRTGVSSSPPSIELF